MPPSLDEKENYQGDAIVVKDEYSWSRPSSPDSMSPEMELEPQVVANLLAQINTPQRLESPEPLEDDISKPNPPPENSNARPTQAPSHPSRHKPRINNTTMEERLMQMPEKRPLPWRDGVEPGADNETGGESRRKQIRFGCLLATRGEIQEVPCNSCANGRGKFNVCVALEGYFKGACASCQLSGRPNRCSIKKNDDPDVLTTPGAVETPRRNSQYQPLSEGPQIKRRRTDQVPEWENARTQWEQELSDSHPRMNEIIQRPWTTVNSPLPAPNPQPPLKSMNGSQGPPQTSSEHRNPMGWATVNQPVPPPPIQQPFNPGSEGRAGSYHSNLEQGKQEEAAGNEESSVALIDTLPKNKQRQVYGLVSGLQGGIEHLQRELDSLKKALGIDDED